MRNANFLIKDTLLYIKHESTTQRTLVKIEDLRDNFRFPRIKKEPMRFVSKTNRGELLGELKRKVTALWKCSVLGL